MTILEQEVTGEKAHLFIDGKEYMLLSFGSSKHVTVLCGRWCHDRRALGKTFWSLEDLEANYKKHGKILVEYVSRFSVFAS